MSRDPLLSLHAIRLRDVEAARQALGICLMAETEAINRIGSLNDAVRRDREAESTVEDGYRFLNMFAARQTSVRNLRRTADADLVTLRSRCDAARAAVAAARATAEAVGQLIDERAAIERAEAAKRDQHVLDDIVRFNRRGKPGRADRPAGAVWPGEGARAPIPDR